MKGIVWLCLLAAAFATGVVGFLVLKERPRPDPGPPPFAATPAATTAEPAAREEVLRPHETTATLVEDLRDALAGPREALGGEVRRVSLRLATRARSALLDAAPGEASPKVRALLVLAAGVHVPDEGALLAFLDDREPVVRRAAALATAHAEGGAEVPLLEGVKVPVGRTLPEPTRGVLAERLAREEDEGVRGTIVAALGP